MKYNLLFFFACLLTSLQAQQPVPGAKGASPMGAENTGQKTGQTYAVVVGISDYQDKGIPDLRFAHKDAEAFANFLRSPAGGNLDGDHMKVLLNSEATMAQFASALDWLWELCREGDQAIIYFSGHGDVEKKSISQPGFLLCWDAPARVYMGGGAFALPMLQEVISTLSIQNKAKVVVITDACRSGTLAGQSIGGAQATAANLAKQYANEIKILSCQPNEYSIEGEQWGGGRGAFSFNLVDALYGMADQNQDLFVTLQEVGRYLEDHVSAEVAPVSQVPMVLGNRTERLTTVDSKFLADLRSGRTSQMRMLSPVESRGLEEEVLAALDTTIREAYRLFQQSLKDKRFLEPAGSCAETYYEKLIAEPKLVRLHSTLTRNYAAALQDDAQQVMNTMLKTGLTEEIRSATSTVRLYGQYPRYLQRASELLGESHYMYASLQARKCFFEAKTALGIPEAKQAYQRALHWLPDMPQALAEMIFTYKAEEADSAHLYFNKAVTQTPNWVVPYLYHSLYYEFYLKQLGPAEEMLQLAGEVDSTSALIWYYKAKFYNRQQNYQAAEHWATKAIAGADSAGICFPCANGELAMVYYFTGRLPEAEAVCMKALERDPNFIYANAFLAAIYKDSERYDEAETLYKKVIQLDSTFTDAYHGIGTVYHLTGRYAEAEIAYKKAIQLDSSFHYTYFNLACLYVLLGQMDKAFEMLDHYLKRSVNEYDFLQQNDAFEPLRQQTDKWKALMKKHFPEQSKD